MIGGSELRLYVTHCFYNLYILVKRENEMKEVNTRYGIIKGVSYMDCYPDGTLKSCVVTEPNELLTPYGKLAPLFQDNEVRRKSGKPVTFYLNGYLKNLPLQNQTGIPTPLGVLPAENLAFYEEGSLHRVFPLDGKMSGYWTEEDERNLAYEMDVQFSCGRFKSRIIGIQFYPHGVVKSITLWPGELVSVKSPLGPIEVRTGLSFYPGGELKTLEPARPTPVQTPVGTINAYNCQAIGLNGDANSLCFSAAGTLISLVTSSDEIELTGKTGEKHLFRPGLIPNLFNPEVLDPVPLKVEFADNKILLCQDGVTEFDIRDYTFAVKPLTLQDGCSGCSSCMGCSESTF